MRSTRMCHLAVSNTYRCWETQEEEAVKLKHQNLGEGLVSVFHTGSRCCEHLLVCWKHLGMGMFFPSTLSLPLHTA